MADLPARKDIDAMVELIGGESADFDNLPPADKMQIIALVNQADLLGEIFNLRSSVDDLDKSLTHVGEWFRYSKTYEGG